MKKNNRFIDVTKLSDHEFTQITHIQTYKRTHTVTHAHTHTHTHFPTCDSETFSAFKHKRHFTSAHHLLRWATVSEQSGLYSGGGRCDPFSGGAESPSNRLGRDLPPYQVES